MKPGNSRKNFFVAAAQAVVFLFLAGAGFAAGHDIQVNATQPRRIALTTGKSVIIESPAAMKRISMADPNVADALILTPRQVYITGKGPGITNLTLWTESDTVAAVFDVEVGPDVGLLKAKLHEIFPEEPNIRVSATNNAITLTGGVSGIAALSQVAAVAESYAPVGKEGKAKLVNLLQVEGVQQVMLEVRVSEMSRALTKQLGFNLAGVSATGKQFGVSLLNGLSSPTGGGVSGSGVATGIPGTLPANNAFPGNGLSISSAVTGMLRFLVNGQSWTTFIDALQDNGLLRVLAEPTLITLSGKSANFLAGGEFPIPVPQAGGSVPVITIQYKPYGVGLTFTPIVLGNGRISMVVAPEVSQLDYSQAISLQGFIIPSITTRRVSTTVELADGQSFAIAGLLSDEVKEDVQKYPLLGNIPILGALFRSSSFQKSETELVVLVTPHLVKPLDLSKQALPTDAYVAPSDFEFYLEGRLEGRQGRETPAPGTSKKGGLEGDFGYMPPGREEDR